MGWKTSSHTYHEEVAEEIFNNIGDYLPLMEKVLETLKRSNY